MYLYFCILTGASLLLICFTEAASNYAVSSQSYDREDVSSSYKYNLIHLYTTTKPHHHSKHKSNHKYHNKSLPQNLSQQVNYQNIQYAPLPLWVQERHSSQSLPPKQDVLNPELYTEANTSVYDDGNIEERDLPKDQKSNIAPRAPIESLREKPRKYVPGYNVDLQAVNNKLLQNGLYANNPNFLVKNKQVKVSYLQMHANNQKGDSLKKSPQNSEAKPKEVNSEFTYQYPQDIKKYIMNSVPKERHDEKNSEKRPFFYMKAPIVELNLARSHRIAHTAHKASVNVNSSFRKLPSFPQEFFSNLKIAPHSHQPSKTQLYPVQNSKLYMVPRTA